MITAFRIDERLIHGQVIATWLKSLGVTHLIVGNDACGADKKQQQILKMAVPSSVKCTIKDIDSVIKLVKDPRCETLRIMLIVGNPKDAYKILKEVPEIKETNLANYGSITKPDVPNKMAVSPMVYLDKEDVEDVNNIISIGKPVFTQKTPVEQRKSIKQL